MTPIIVCVCSLVASVFLLINFIFVLIKSAIETLYEFGKSLLKIVVIALIAGVTLHIIVTLIKDPSQWKEMLELFLIICLAAGAFAIVFAIVATILSVPFAIAYSIVTYIFLGCIYVFAWLDEKTQYVYQQMINMIERHINLN